MTNVKKHISEYGFSTSQSVAHLEIGNTGTTRFRLQLDIAGSLILWKSTDSGKNWTIEKQF